MLVKSASRTGILQAVTPEIPTIDTLRLEVPFKFKAGQSVQVNFPGDAEKRFYSISSSPTEGSFIEITVKSEKGSSLARAIAGLKIGDALPVEGPFGGSLSLPEPVRSSLAFIAAGTGVTPFRSMIRYLFDEVVPVDHWLLHSVRSRAELLFQDDFMTWAGQRDMFRYVPTITREDHRDWKYDTGRITETLIRKHVVAHDTLYYLCGPSTFVADMETMLRDALHIPAERIRREKW
jgi:ferredoxin-NADP reductase